ncbi:MAG TPA: superoxide dismutase [Kofleriaceae bacterium]|nr:superoxide dismutase [Kofleriaceae bacterium]
MAFTLPELPYAKDALAPVISQETIEYHYGKHHAAYVNKLNELTQGKPLAELSLEEVVKKTWKQPSDQPVFNNAAQVWNHTFYWNCLSPKGGGDPTGKVAEAISKAFGDFKSFKEKFAAAAVGRFGSGWAWLVKTDGGGVAIETTPNAETPMADGKTCLLTCDVWEHAYYVDYRNARPKYVEEFWKLVNWDFVSKNL